MVFISKQEKELLYNKQLGHHLYVEDLAADEASDRGQDKQTFTAAGKSKHL